MLVFLLEWNGSRGAIRFIMALAMNGEITRHLIDWNGGDQGALDRLLPLVYDELRHIASRSLRGERAHQTLRTTALLNEAYLKLVDQKRADWQNRAQFLGVAAGLMRRILVDHAREQRALKRGGGETLFSFDGQLDSPVDQAGSLASGVSLVALNDALEDLRRLDEDQFRIVEMRYFAGLTLAEIAAVLKVSLATVKREWQMARAWLYRHLSPG